MYPGGSARPADMGPAMSTKRLAHLTDARGGQSSPLHEEVGRELRASAEVKHQMAAQPTVIVEIALALNRRAQNWPEGAILWPQPFAPSMGT